MTTPAIMAYVGGTHLTGVSINTVMPDWAHDRIYFMDQGGTAAEGIRQFESFTLGTETLSLSAPEIGVSYVFAGANTVTYGGNIVFIASTISNSVLLGEVRAADLDLLAIFGVASSSLAASTNARILAPTAMATMRDGSTVFTVTVGGGNEICVQEIPGMTNTRIGAVDEAYAAVGPGAIAAGAGTAFVLGKSSPGAGANTTPLGLYVVTSAKTMSKKGTITPAQIDATWSHFSVACGVAYDQVDGNPIIMAQTSDVVTNQTYFVKLNKANAAVIWTCPVNIIDTYGDENMSRHYIANQTLYYMGTGGRLYTINTSTGVATSAVISSLGVSGGQVSEDVDNSIVLMGSWTEGTTHPTYVGNYMGTLGNHALTSKWTRYFPLGQPATSAWAGTPGWPPTVAVESISRAWTFTLDGHSFYVLDLGNEGTWVYDTTTQQWANFVTAGFDRWDMANGTMWGKRIVAGDFLTTDLWELVPSALKDNGALSIAHLVTGELVTRSRDAIGVNALRISGSTGQLDDVAGSSLSMRYSDDQGQTWSAPQTVTLTQGAFGDDLEFRSLGSYAAPGRVFEISDSGGLIRIDGCDAFLDGEENADAQE